MGDVYLPPLYTLHIKLYSQYHRFNKLVYLYADWFEAINSMCADWFKASYQWVCVSAMLILTSCA